MAMAGGRHDGKGKVGKNERFADPYCYFLANNVLATSASANAVSGALFFDSQNCGLNDQDLSLKGP